MPDAATRDALRRLSAELDERPADAEAAADDAAGVGDVGCQGDETSDGGGGGGRLTVLRYFAAVQDTQEAGSKIGPGL